MELKGEKYRVRHEQFAKDKIRDKGLRYGPGGLEGTAHCKLGIYQWVADQQWHTAGERSALLLGWGDDYSLVHLFHLLRTDVASAGEMCLFMSITL